MTVFALPDLGEGLRDAEILAWHVAPGDHVVTDQPLLQVETDKAVIDIPSPRAGLVSRLYGQPGERISVGAPLMEFADEAGADAGAIVGEVPPPAAAGQVAPSGPSVAPPTSVERVPATPAARALARRLGVSLEAVRGTGPGGAVTPGDVERSTATVAPEGYEPLSGPRLAMARNMARARDEVAPATVMDDAQVDDWVEHEDATVRLLRAIAAGCAAEPALNGWFDSAGPARRLSDTVDVGIAVETEVGLFVPVLRDVNRSSAGQLRRELDVLEAAVRDRTIAPGSMRDATIGLSNFGTLGGRYAVMTIPSPQLAILGAGRIEVRAVVRDGRIEARRSLPLSLTFDHRAVTGGEAARFLAAVIEDLEAAS